MSGTGGPLDRSDAPHSSTPGSPRARRGHRKLTRLVSQPSLSDDSPPVSRHPSLSKSLSNPGSKLNVSQRKPQLRRTQSIREKISAETAKFFGVQMESPENESPRGGDTAANSSGSTNASSSDQYKWQRRRFRHLNSQYGVKADAVAGELHTSETQDLMEPLADQSEPSEPSARSSVRSTSRRPPADRRDSVAKIAYDSLSLLVQGNAFRKNRLKKVPETREAETVTDGQPSAEESAATTPRYTSIRQRAAVPPSGRSFYTPSPMDGTDALIPHHQPIAELSRSADFAHHDLSSSVLLPRAQTEHSIPRPRTLDLSLMRKESIRVGNEIELSDLTTSTQPPPTDFPTTESRERFDFRSEPPTTSTTRKPPLKSQPSISMREVFFDLHSPSTTEETPQVEVPSFAQRSHRRRSMSRDSKNLFHITTIPVGVEDEDKPSTSAATAPMQRPTEEVRIDVEGATPMVAEAAAAAESGIVAGVPHFPIDWERDRRPRTATDTSRPTTADPQRRVALRQALMGKEQRPTIPMPPPVQPPPPTTPLPTAMAASSAPSTPPDGALAKLRALAQSASRMSFRRPLWWRQLMAARRRRERKLPIFGTFKRRKCRDPYVMKQLGDQQYDYRPFFTYWITTVQVIITLYSVFYYGIGTDFSHGVGVIERSGDVLASSLSAVHIVVWEQNNVWIGPRYADLVHIGAKYTPCMRADARITAQIEADRAKEADTGCCIGPDRTCFQTSDCPRQFATFLRFEKVTNSKDGRPLKQPVVCGQDPRYCAHPASIPPNDWGQNVTSWPICTRPTPYIPRKVAHMNCEISGRPCCIQMHGQCRITTKEYCDFVNGYYHPNATLCSQVSCLNDVCGMTPFVRQDKPDQFYRFVIPLFIHAGLIRCLITCALQLTIMRRFELMIGCLRLSIIYFVSGIGGYLASASFVPYMPEVGPAGSQGGVLGALIINVIYNWRYLRRPGKAMVLHLSTAAALFITGLLPYIDNWAQLFGFLFGILMAAALIPYMSFGNVPRLIVVTGSVITTILLFALLLVLFYGLPVIDFPILSLFNCPFIDSKVCDQQGLILRNWLPI